MSSDDSHAGGDDGSDGEESDSDESRKPKKEVFKAAKLNPVLYEDKETKKQRRD